MTSAQSSVIKAIKATLWLYVVLTLLSVQSIAQKIELVVETGHSREVFGLNFSRDGKFLISSGGDTKLWRVDSRKQLRSLRTDIVEGVTEQIVRVVSNVDAKLQAGYAGEQIIVWDLVEGKVLEVFKSESRVNSVALTPDRKSVVSCHEDKTITWWNLANGKPERRLTPSALEVEDIRFTPNGEFLIAVDADNNLIAVDTATFKIIPNLKARANHNLSGSLLISPDGKRLAAITGEALFLWDLPAGTELPPLRLKGIESLQPMIFSNDNNLIVTVNDQGVVLRDVSTGEITRTFGTQDKISSIALSPANLLAAGNDQGQILTWDLVSGASMPDFVGHTKSLSPVSFSPDGRTLRGRINLETPKFFDAVNGNKVIAPIVSNGYKAVAVNREQTLYVGQYGGSKLFDFSGKELFTLAEDPQLRSFVFSQNGRWLAGGAYFSETLGGGGEVRLWDLEARKQLPPLRSDLGGIIPFVKVAFSNDSRLVAGAVEDALTVWNVATRKQLFSIHQSSDGKGFKRNLDFLSFSPDGKQLITTHGNEIHVWDLSSGKELPSKNNLTSLWSLSVIRTTDGRLLAAGDDEPGGATMKIWNVEDGKELASITLLDETDWAVVTPEGRFDASPNGMKLMHYAYGLETIDLQQLKSRYYEPGLLAKIMGFNKEPFRDVANFATPRLNPDVNFDAPTNGSNLLKVSLRNRGGGIGRIQIFVNGKEFLDDARSEELKRNQELSQTTISVDLSSAPGMIAGAQNDIRVVAWNVENYIASRGEEKSFVATGVANREPPEVYAIVGGISQYAAPLLKLRFAATDAVAFANAIELGAKRLFGAEKVHLTLLTTANDSRAIAPTKDNFAKAFAATRRAKPRDILIVYLAGHAITLKRGGADTYCYLTSEAESFEVSDPEVRRQRTITSDDLVEWIKLIPANKQAVMLDTCAAGAAQDQLLTLARAATGDAVRAIELAMDRTGSHFLMGSAADAESFETTEYGQGLLTYALLRGLKGEALDDAGVVDVDRLFRFARDEVEKLAKNIDRIQKPKVSAPKGDTFPVGRLTREDTERIVLAAKKPMILRPRFQEEQTDDDILDLMKQVRELLRDETSPEPGAVEAAFGFSNTEDFPGGIRPVCRYSVEGNKVTVMLRLRRDGVEIAKAQVIGTKDEIAAKLIAATKAAIKKL